jgi:hypothetical protein
MKTKICSATLGIACAFILVNCPNVFAQSTTEDKLRALDARRNELTREVTAQLASGHLSAESARNLSQELQSSNMLQSQLKSDTDKETYISALTASLNETKSHIDAQVTKKKAWIGIDPRNTVMDRKIADALASGRIDKETAGNLQREEDSWKARAASSRSETLDFSEALGLADDYNRLDSEVSGVAKPRTHRDQ